MMEKRNFVTSARTPDLMGPEKSATHSGGMGQSDIDDILDGASDVSMGKSASFAGLASVDDEMSDMGSGEDDGIGATEMFEASRVRKERRLG